MKKNHMAKVFAIFALAGISTSIVGTGILVLISSNQEPQTYSAEELKNLNIYTGSTSTGELENSIKIVNSGALKINSTITTNTGKVITEKTNTGEVK